MYFQQISKTILVTATLSIAPWTASLAQSAPEAIVENWVSAAKSLDFLNVSHDGIQFDAASGITTITNLSVKFEVSNVNSKVKSNDQTFESKGKLEYKMEFPSVEFANLALENGYYSASSIKADMAKLDFEIIADQAGASSSATGSYEGFLVNNVKWASLPDVIDNPAKPISKYYPLVAALIDISFDNALFGGMKMKQSIAGDAVNMQINYGPTSIGKTVSGNLSNMTMSGINIAVRAAEGTDPEAAKAINSDVTFGDMTASEYNYGTLVRSFAPGRTSSADATYENAMGELKVGDVRITSASGKFSFDHWTMREFGVRPPRVSVLDEADKLFLAQQATGEEPDPKKLIELVAGAYGAFRLGDFELAGLKVDIPGAAKGKMDLYKISDLSSNGLGEFLLKGINFNGSGAYFNLDLFSIADIKFPALDALMNAEEAGKNNDVVAIMKAIPTIGKFQTRGVDVRVPGQGDVALKESTLDMSGFIGPIPTKLDLNVEGLKLPVSMLEGQAKQVFSAMGFKEIMVSYGLSAVWTEATKILAMNTKASLKDGGNIDVDVNVGGIPRSAFENPTKAQQVMAFLTVNSANIVFDDQSIVDKGMGIVAAQQGVDVATLKAQAVGLLPFVLQMLNKPQFVNELSAAVKKFLDSGGSIRASATPSAPVSVMQLIGVGASAPGAVIDLLNIKVEAK